MKFDEHFLERLHAKLEACLERKCDLDGLPADEEYLEIHKLREMLVAAQISHVFKRLFDGWQVCYPEDRQSENCVCDAVQHFGSYGSEDDRLELMGLLNEQEEEEYGGVLGYLTAQEVFERIKTHWEANHDSI